MAKAPLAGVSKTRLQRESGLPDESVARLAAAFLQDTLAACASLDGVDLVVCFAPRDSEAVMRAHAPGAALWPQVEGDLGARMQAAFDGAFRAGSGRVVVIGTDTPHVRASTLRSAFDALERADCVLGPAEDGGYTSIGLRAPRPELFADVAWSTPSVLAQTLARARRSGIACARLEPEFDIDGLADLRRLARAIECGDARCHATARVLATLDLGG